MSKAMKKVFRVVVLEPVDFKYGKRPKIFWMMKFLSS